MAPDAVMRWEALATRFGAKYAIERDLVLAVIWQESGGNPWAMRVERGFWSRYLPGITAWVKRTPSKADDRWAQYPDVYSASYGLMQTLVQSAAESGFTYTFPTELCDPETNLDVGCRILATKIQKAGSVRQGLLAWNGGGAPQYDDEVLAKRNEIRSGRGAA